MQVHRRPSIELPKTVEVRLGDSIIAQPLCLYQYPIRETSLLHVWGKQRPRHCAAADSTAKMFVHSAGDVMRAPKLNYTLARQVYFLLAEAGKSCQNRYDTSQTV